MAERAGPGRAREFVMTGGLYDAPTLERWGVVNRVVGDDELQLLDGGDPGPGLRAGRTADRVAEGAAVDDLLDRLSADRREAFVLTQLVGLPYAEAAAVAGVPVGTIRSRVARARADLVTALAEPGGVTSGG